MYFVISPNPQSASYVSLHKAFLALAFALALTLPCSEACGRGSVQIKDNGYRQVLIAIGDNVAEDINLIHRLQEVFTKASAFLYNITRQRAYFAEITILIPKTWGDVSGFEPATNQTMDVSDIVVDTFDQSYSERHKPFVVRSSPCGQLGEYMQLTPEYLTSDVIADKFGAYEKVIIHEWAHLRYGVFDEYADGGIGSSFFYAAQNGEIEGTRCSSTLQGDFYDVIKKNALCDFENGLPNKDCRFTDQKNVKGKYGSLMYNHQLAQVTEFCDNDHSSPNTLHNREAPSKQNQRCDGRSVWEVLREHEDFKDDVNPPRQLGSTRPTFRFVKHSTKRTVIVLDTSGSMSHNNKLVKLAQAVQNYILNIAVDGEQIGIVWFSGTAIIKAHLTPVNDTTRGILVKRIPQKARGATSIGGGLRKALDVLSYGNQNPAGGIILLVSDGKETSPPWVADLQYEIMSSNVIVDSIAITEQADNKIEVLSTETSGKSFYYSAEDNSNALNEAFIAQSERGTDILDRPIQLSSESVRLEKNQSFEENIVIDSTIGRKTEFVIGYSVNVVTIELTTPSGRIITHKDPECTSDPVFKSTRFKIPGLAERGVWYLRVLNPNPFNEPITITVTSSIVSGTLPIVAVARWAKRSVTLPNERQILYVSVTQGLHPVLEAIVEASLERPASTIDSQSTSAKPITFKVLDNGAGSDVTRNDGIYSAYITEFTDNGRYNVKVRVNDSPVTVIVKDGIVGTSGSESPVLNRQRRSVGSKQKTDKFGRVTSAGSFRLLNFTAGIDVFPPAKITDLRVSGVSFDEGVRLTWTATGEDLDRGTASSYVIWKSTDLDTLYDDHQSAENIPATIKPKEAGNGENLTIYIDNKDKSTYFFTIEAIDKNGNSSPRSNIVSVSMKHVKQPWDLALTIGLCIGISILLLLGLIGLIIYYRYKKRILSQKGEHYKQNVQKTNEKTMKY